MANLFQPNAAMAETLANEAFTVSQITGLIKTTIESVFPSVTIQGEISNFRPSSTGHWYFTLKDEAAAISAVMFKGKLRYVDFAPKDGMLVQAKGSLSVYPQRGTYQIVVDSLAPAGTGDILQLLEERKRKLDAEGLFDEANKRPLPAFPQTIGVVTSPTGAALQDILNISRRRNDSVSVVVLPCPVQGAEAAAQIARQIEVANEHALADVLIVGRGGGSLEDLLPFSEECVVRAIAASHIPVVSAVGHEIDVALSDFAADLRAPTPSAAAELVTPLKSDMLATLADYAEDLYQSVQARLERTRLMLQSFSLENMTLRLRSIQSPLLQRLDYAKEDLAQAMQGRIDQTRSRLFLMEQLLENAHPQRVLERGFAIVRKSASGEVVRRAAQLKGGERVHIQTAAGSAEAVVAGSPAASFAAADSACNSPAPPKTNFANANTEQPQKEEP